jgi:uncharacterized RDD family membrane protein YckC
MRQMQTEFEDVTGKRVLACLIDYTFLFLFSWFYITAVGEPNKEGGASVSGLPALVPVLVWFAWLVLTEAKWGQTLGHALIGLKIVSMGGSTPEFVQVLKRRLCDAIEISWCFSLVAFLITKNTPHRQRLGDIVGKIIVVPKHYRPGSFDFGTRPSALESSR